MWRWPWAGSVQTVRILVIDGVAVYGHGQQWAAGPAGLGSSGQQRAVALAWQRRISICVALLIYCNCPPAAAAAALSS